MGAATFIGAVFRPLDGKQDKLCQRWGPPQHIILNFKSFFSSEGDVFGPKGCLNFRFRKCVKIKCFVVERQPLPHDRLMTLRTERYDRDWAVDLLFYKIDVCLHGIRQTAVSAGA